MNSKLRRQEDGKRVSANKHITKFQLGNVEKLIDKRQRAKLAAAYRRRAKREQLAEDGNNILDPAARGFLSAACTE